MTLPSINLNPDLYPSPDAPMSGPIVLPNSLASIEGTRSGAPVEGSPDWWLERLLKRLLSQLTYCRAHWRYYEGEQPLAFASEKFREAYGTRYRDLPSNFMPLVVEAEKERLIVQGFRFGASTEADRTAWQIWQANNLDAESQIAHEITLAKGASFVLITPPGQDERYPLITVEDPEQVVLETLPGNRRKRLAALKAWKGDDGYFRAYLYLPDEIYKYRSRSPVRTGSVNPQGVYGKASNWVPERPPGEDFPIRNVLGVVPIIPLLNRPTLDGSGRSEMVPIIGNQNAINFLRFSALIGSDVAALPQRWAKNLDLQVDPDTGQIKQPFKAGVTNLYATRRPTPEESAAYGDRFPEVEFGQFPGAQLSPFTQLIEQEIGSMASISRTPYHYLLGDPGAVPPTGESIKSSEAPLVKKVVAQAIHFGEGWEEAMRTALIAANQRSKARQDAETIWADPETRNEAAHNQAIMLQWEKGLIPDEFALEELGYSAQQIARIKKLRETPGAEPPGAGAPPPTPEPEEEPPAA